MTSDFARAFPIVWRRENGGMAIAASDNPADPGGYTRGGIALNRHPTMTRAQLDAMTYPQFSDYYRQAYWTPNSCDFLPWPVNLCVFDGEVNAGSEGAKALQKAMGTRYTGQIDGVIGNMTLAAVARFTPVELACRTMKARDDDYRAMADWDEFGTGWLIRLFQNLFEAGSA